MEKRLLKRCISLLLQRLSRSSEGWTEGILAGFVSLLAFIDSRLLCGSVPMKGTQRRPSALNNLSIAHAASVVNASFSSSVDVIDTLNSDDSLSLVQTISQSPYPPGPQSPNSRVTQTSDEFQIMSFLNDSLTSLRKSVEKTASSGGSVTKDERFA